jgi:hypothetical protein
MRYEASGVPATEAQAEMLALYQERWGAAREDLFRWAYLDNPLGPSRCFVLRADGRAVGAVGVGVRALHAGVGGRKLTAGLLGDFFVAKGHRTFFPALILQRSVLTWAKDNVDVVYGFPNPLAVPLIKKLQFQELAHLERRVLVLRHHRHLARHFDSALVSRGLALPLDAFRRHVHPRTFRRPPRGTTFGRFEQFDASFERLCRATPFPGVTLGHRDPKLLQWRFFARLDQPCVAYGLRDRATSDAISYAVIHVEGDMAHIRDLFALDVETMAQTVLLVAEQTRSLGCVAVSFIGASPPEVDRRLDELGFKTRALIEGRRILYGHTGRAAPDAAGHDALASLGTWYASEFDEDQ